MQQQSHYSRADEYRVDSLLRTAALTISCSLWLPVCILVVFALGDFSFGIYDDRPIESLLSIFMLMWPFGIPLALAVQLIYRRSRILAFVVAAVCAPISVTAYFLGLPLPSFANSLLGALLAWFVLVVFYLVMGIRDIGQRMSTWKGKGVKT